VAAAAAVALYSVLIEPVLCGSEQHNWLINNFRSTVGQFRDVAFAPCGYTVWNSKNEYVQPLHSVVQLDTAGLDIRSVLTWSFIALERMTNSIDTQCITGRKSSSISL
jgi:hypothetical protein